MPTTAPQLNRKYTYADYLTWDDDQRWELIRGEPYAMSLAPRPRHQRIVAECTRQIANFLQGHSCQLFPAPFDVRFAKRGETADEETDTTVQPDLSVICDSNKIDDRGCAGPPDLIVEVLSEATAGRDEETKFFLYQEHGVREYWIVNPWDETVRIYNLNDHSRYSFPRFIIKTEPAKSHVLNGLEINLTEVFPKQSPV